MEVIDVRVRVVAFARLRELIGAPDQTLECDAPASVRDVWALLAARVPGLETLAGSTRAARNGRLVSFDEALSDGDELALLPPVGGG